MIKKITLNDIHRCIKEAIMREVGDDIPVPSQGETMSQDDDVDLDDADSDEVDLDDTDDNGAFMNVKQKEKDGKTKIYSVLKPEYQTNLIFRKFDNGQYGLYVDTNGRSLTTPLPVLDAWDIKEQIREKFIKPNHFYDETYLGQDNGTIPIPGKALFQMIKSGILHNWFFWHSFYENKKGENFKPFNAQGNLGNWFEYIFGKMNDTNSMADFDGAELKTYNSNSYEIELFNQSPQDIECIDYREQNPMFRKLQGSEWINFLKSVKPKEADNQIRTLSATNNKVAEYVNNGKIFAQANIDKKTNTIKTITINTKFLGQKNKVIAEANIIYDAKDAIAAIEANNNDELNKFSKVITGKLNGLLKLDTVKLRLDDSFMKDKLVPQGRTDSKSGKYYTFAGIRDCNFYTIQSMDKLLLNFINCVNEGYIKIYYAIKKESITSHFKIKNSNETFEKLYDTHQNAMIQSNIPKEIILHYDGTASGDDIIYQNDKETPNNVNQTINENTLNLLVTETVKRILSEIK